MIAQTVGLFRRMEIVIGSFLIVICLLQVLTACGTVPSGKASSPAATSQTTLPSESHLQGPIDFVLNNILHFSQASGTAIVNGKTTQLKASAIESGTTETFQHTLFVVDSHNAIVVYSSGSTLLIHAQVTRNADESTTIQYTSSSKTATNTFHGTLIGSRMIATYNSQFISSTTVDNQQFVAASDRTTAFTTQVTWVLPDDIPASPTKGQYQLTSDGGVALSWKPGTAGGKIRGYDVYRFVLLGGQGFQLIARTTATSYTDESQIAIKNAQTITGIAYAIYAVGPTGIENPQEVDISVSSLG